MDVLPMAIVADAPMQRGDATTIVGSLSPVSLEPAIEYWLERLLENLDASCFFLGGGLGVVGRTPFGDIGRSSGSESDPDRTEAGTSDASTVSFESTVAC